MRYRVKILNASMKVEILELEAENDEEINNVVGSSGGRILSVTPLRSGMNQYRWRSTSFNLTVFNQQLHTLLEAGQPIVEAIEVLGKNDRHQQNVAIYDSLLQSLRQGKQFSDAMALLPSVFPLLYVAMVRASETTGTVNASVKRFMTYQQQADDIKRKLVSAAIYPAILVAVGFIVIVFLMLYVVPRFSVVFDDVALTKNATAGFIQTWGRFVRYNTEFAWLGVFAFVGILVSSVLHPGIRNTLFIKMLSFKWLGDKIWILQLARMYRTLSMLLQSGVSILVAMRMAGESLPIVMRKNLENATQAVNEGNSISSSMKLSQLGSEIALRLLIAGESSGNLDKMMEKIADFYDQETATWVDTAGRLIEPILMVGIGLVIGAIVLMLYSPIFDLANAV